MLKLLFTSAFLGLVFISCKKEPVTRSLVSAPLQPPTPAPTYIVPVYPAPAPFAGPDIYIVFPEDSYTLKGSAQYPQYIESILWHKISGPDSWVIENSGSFETKLHNLKRGIYLFELRATDKAGRTGGDTVSVFVLQQGSGENEMIFKDLQWVCPMGCHIRIDNFHFFVPIGVAFKAYLKRDDSTQWTEVLNRSGGFGKYVWTIYNNGLEILEDQTEYPDGSPDLKIIF